MDVWSHVAQLAPDWSTLSALGSVNRYLRDFLRHQRLWLKLPLSRTQTLALEAAVTWATTSAIMAQKCELCRASYPRGRVCPVWRIYVHEDCLRSRLVDIDQAVLRYDLPFDRLQRLPHFPAGSLWKFHGGEPWPFRLADTVQGVALIEFRENLHDRRLRLQRQRQQLRGTFYDDSAYQQAWAEDERALKRRRLSELEPRRSTRLEPMLAQLPRLAPAVKEAVRSLCYQCINMPCSWRHLEDVLRVWEDIELTPELRDQIRLHPRVVLTQPKM